MKRILAGFVFILMICSACTGDTFVHSTSKQMGIQAFDVNVAEIARTENTSTLKISVIRAPATSRDSAVMSRWLMCLYNALAAKRKFDYWVEIYPARPSDNVIIGFPSAPTGNLGKTLGPEFEGKAVLGPVFIDDIAQMCSAFTPAAPN